ncbi:Zinc/iron permease [Trametes sanguinea]|nr:Zinc/iron permease [Trametes sanguinea]
MLLHVQGCFRVLGKTPETEVEDADVVTRLLIMVVIFAVSLAAVSFPTITETYRSIRVPSICFFIGKHFGTGVILSTAFVHLLQDAFKALQSPEVNQRWRVDNWAGMIVLGSLLIIFLVEYTSTAFVDRLHSYSSAPSSPTVSPASSSASSIRMEYEGATDPFPEVRPSIVVQSPQGTKSWVARDSYPRQQKRGSRDSMHQVGAFTETGHPSGAPLPLAPPELADESRDGHASSGGDEFTPLNASPLPPSMAGGSYGTVSTTRSSPRIDRASSSISGPAGDVFFSGGHHRHEPRHSHASHHGRASRWSWFPFTWMNGETGSPLLEPASVAHLPSTRSQCSKRRTRVDARKRSAGSGELGPHVADEGLEGVDHEEQAERERGGRRHGHSHLDMERWMDHMDERTNGAVHCDSSSDEECGSEAGDEQVKVGRRRQVIGILVLQLGIMIHSLVIGLTLSITSGSEFTSLVVAIVFHQLFEGLSLGIRIAGLPSKRSEGGFQSLPGHTLKPLLAITFATTTPLGIGIGIAALGGAKSTGPRLMLVQGVMSAISAGMLIYAACVEMLAGDFVMDAHLWRSSVRRQVLALVSLFAGVVAMAAIGFLD